MTTRQEVLNWFDENGLIGRKEFPNSGEEGNPISETSVAYILLKSLGLNIQTDSEKFSESINKLKSNNGIYVKKYGTKDQITSDDIIPLCAASSVYKTDHRFVLYTHGIKTGFVYSNEWGGVLKPWQIAFVALSTGANLSIWELIYLIGSIIFDAIFRQQNDPSSKRITWCILVSSQGKSVLIDLASKFWAWRIEKKYGGLHRVFVAFYGEKHIISKLATELYEGQHGL